MSSTFRGMGTSNLADVIDKVLTYISVKKLVKRSQILRVMYGDLDMWMLEQVERVLLHMKVIEMRIITGENDVEYKYVGPPTA